PALLGDAGEWRGELPAGVVDQAVDAAGPLQRARGHGAHPILVADVAGDGVGGAPGIRDLGPHALESLGLASDQDDGGTEAGQLVRRTATDAAAAPGGDGGLPREQTRAEDRIERHARS